jgi:hypothetical protein
MLTPYEIDWTVPPDPAEIEQLREVAKLPFSEKLKWLAQVGRMAEHMEKSRAERLRNESASKNAQEES